MIPIKQGTAKRLGLRKPLPQSAWEITVDPIVPPGVFAEFVRQIGESHHQAITDINRIIYRVANGMRRGL